MAQRLGTCGLTHYFSRFCMLVRQFLWSEFVLVVAGCSRMASLTCLELCLGKPKSLSMWYFILQVSRFLYFVVSVSESGNGKALMYKPF